MKNVMFACVGLLLVFACMHAYALATHAPTTGSTSPATTHTVVRINQLSPSQYTSSQQYETWAGSACSLASMSEVLNAYGRHDTIGNLIPIATLPQVHAVSPTLGLLDDGGIARTVAQFGFQTTSGHTLTLDQIIARANGGTPVIVSVQDDHYFPPGHVWVVTGGTSTTVTVADSSSYDFTQLARTQFLRLWHGYSAVVTPQGGQL